MSETLRKLGLIGIGVLAITEEKIRQTVDELIEKGEMNREEGKSLVQELLTEKKKQMQELGDRISEDVQWKRRLQGLRRLLRNFPRSEVIVYRSGGSREEGDA
jgi:polyhydroxyalkanoate synthesis regulator phasin